MRRVDPPLQRRGVCLGHIGPGAYVTRPVHVAVACGCRGVADLGPSTVNEMGELSRGLTNLVVQAAQRGLHGGMTDGADSPISTAAISARCMNE